MVQMNDNSLYTRFALELALIAYVALIVLAGAFIVYS
jgi:hypothetical protein